MQRYFFQIAFKGSNFSGWQRQSTAPSVQHSLEDILTKVLRRPTTIHGCGRTDAGVHASQYFFHLDIDPKHERNELLHKLNRSLPKDLVVLDMHKVHPHANAQKNASSRTYQYFIHFEENPFLNDLSFFEDQELDFERMKMAVSILEGKHDFRNFCKSPEKNDNCFCLIQSAQLSINEEGNRMMLEFKGNRFLHNMVRLLVGNLLKIGRNTLEFEEFRSYLHLSGRPKYFDIAYPNGLYLAKVTYPFLDVESKNILSFL